MFPVLVYELHPCTACDLKQIDSTRISQNLGMIESRLEKLDKEKEELSEYYALDKERRSYIRTYLFSCLILRN